MLPKVIASANVHLSDRNSVWPSQRFSYLIGELFESLAVWMCAKVTARPAGLRIFQLFHSGFHLHDSLSGRKPKRKLKILMTGIR
jgi:hypothetical protein